MTVESRKLRDEHCFLEVRGYKPYDTNPKAYLPSSCPLVFLHHTN
jgi:hypothetical protein